MRFSTTLLIVVFLVFWVIPAGAYLIPHELYSDLMELQSGETIPVWVFFTDRGLTENELTEALDQIGELYPKRTIKRREKSGMEEFLARDLPVNLSYIETVEEIVGKVRTITRYFNGVSVNLDLERALSIANLSFISEMRRVASGYRYEPEIKGNHTGTIDLEYGESYEQLEQINVIALHDMGFSGEGVLVCLLDTGYRLDHIAFWNTDIVETWDFINGDSIVSNQPGDPPDQHNHGTYTLSTCGGSLEGMFYGPAYGASFLAYKTEMVDDEIPIEEDYYVAGLERADSLGADVVSTSLGYIDWYDFSDLDGNTTVTAIAVDIAVSNGVTCVTAAGNYRNYSSWPHIITPADADSVISVGAVNIEGELASFSSPGPTADGRIKPEVCACGVDTYCANPYDLMQFTYVSGTSLSTPLVGGAVALLIQVHPNWNPMTVREALMMTASQATNPDNDYGWGIINVLAAAEYSYPPYITSASPEEDTLLIAINDTITFEVIAEDEDNDPLLYSLFIDGEFMQDSTIGEFSMLFSASDTLTITISVEDLLGFQDDTSWVVIVQETRVENLANNIPLDYSIAAYPNPFNMLTNVHFYLPISGQLSVRVFDIEGRLVDTLLSGNVSKGFHKVVFQADNLASGIFFIKMEWQDGAIIKKIILLK